MNITSILHARKMKNLIKILWKRSPEEEAEEGELLEEDERRRSAWTK